MSLPYVETQESGIKFPADLTEDQYREIGGKLAGIQRGIEWFWGDWLAYPDRGAKNESIVGIHDRSLYKVAEDVSGLSYKTLRTRKSVALAFELSRRRDKLTFQHHAELTGVEDPAEQDNWLDKAEDHDWSISELRAAIRQSKKEEAPTSSADDTSRRSQIMRESASLASLLKTEDIDQLPKKTLETMLDQLEPIALFYKQVYSKVY